MLYLGISRGVRLLHSDHQLPDDDPPRVWIRDYQKNIAYSRFSGPNDWRSRTYILLDLITTCPPTKPNKQVIINPSYDEVPTSVFESILEAAVEMDFEDPTSREGEEAMKFLLSNVSRLGNLSGIRPGRGLELWPAFWDLVGARWKMTRPQWHQTLGWLTPRLAPYGITDTREDVRHDRI